MGSSLHISLVLYNSGIFLSGDKLQGEVTITTAKEKDVENIDVTFVGKAKVDYRSGYGKHNHSYFARENVLNSSIVLAGQNGVPLKIPAGVQREFAFSFILPKNLPSTLLQTCYGQLNYYAVATIKNVGDSFPVVSSRQPFTVQSILDLNNIPEAKTPFIRNLKREIYGFRKSKGIVHTTIKLPQTGFALGENIVLAVEIDNQGKKYVDASVTLHRKIYFRARRFSLFDAGLHTKELTNIIKIVCSPKVESGEKIMWNVPDLSVQSVPCSKYTESGIISVQYELKIKIHPKDYDESKVKVPLTIGTIPISKLHRVCDADEARHRNAMTENFSPAYQPSAPSPSYYEDYSDLPPPTYEEAIMSSKT